MGIVRKIFVAIGGAITVAIGLILIPTPAPEGWLIVFAGIALLSTEFSFAKGLMKRARLIRRHFVNTVVHRWFRIPYRLHTVSLRRPSHPRQTVILLHGLGNSSKSWRLIAKQLPTDVRVIAVDLLGFGDSPKPAWATYTIATQARAVAKTILALGLNQKPIIVGHSMGALVAIELAKRFPLLIKQLVLCSPPLYRDSSDTSFNQERLLRKFYESIRQHPDSLQLVAPLAAKLGIVGDSFNIQGHRAQYFVAALEAGIIHQTSLADARNLRLPTMVLYGTFDPVVIGGNLKGLVKDNPLVTVKSFPVGHEMIGQFQDIIADEIHKILKSTN